MKERAASAMGKTFALAALVTLTATACQDLNTFVTGERFLMAPEGSPRIEIELAFSVQDSFYDALEKVADRRELEEEMAQVALSMGDVGMRFYPILSDSYESKKVRPPHMMIVELQKLSVGIDHEMIEEEGQQPWVDSTVKSVACTVTATVEKRRQGAPPLVVGIGQSQGSVRVESDPANYAEPTWYDMKRTADEEEDLQVHRQDILDAFDEALVDALRDVVKAIDREFELASQRPSTN